MREERPAIIPASAERSASASSAAQSAGVSVVIPAYNYAPYLEAAVRSVRTQTYQPLEVIIVDDGSTDETPVLGRRLAAEFPAVRYVWQENAGLSAARNTGLREARYPFVSFLDCDDEFLPEMLESMMAAFRQQAPDTGLVACGAIRVNEAGEPMGEKRLAPPGNRYYTAAHILTKTRFPCCVVARRECFAAVGNFDPALRSSEDRDMWIRIGTRYKIFYLNRALVRIRRHGRNMSRHTDRMRTNMRRVLRKGYAQGIVPALRIDFWLKALAFHYFESGWMYRDEGRAARAIFCASVSLAIWPFPMDHRDMQEPRFFRLRALLRFTWEGLLPKAGRSPAGLV